MSYIGNNLQVAYPSYLIIDDISSQFNGVLKTFALRVAGSTPVPFPINPQQCLISVNNIVQKPDSTGVSGFTLTGSNIVFATAPTAGWSFFGTILAGADYVNVGANFPSGTAAIPSVTFDQSTGTGLFLASSNVLGITTGGVQRLVVNSSGFVGIGTSSPSSFLHLAAASGTVQMQFNSGGTSSYIGHDSAFTGFDIAAGGGIKFRYFNGASFAEAMRITSAGLLGVGTSSPDASYRATIAGSRSAVAPGIFFSDTDASPNNYSLYIDGTKNFVIRDSTNSLNRITVTPAGLVGIGVSGPSSLLHLVSSGQPTITVADDAGRTLQVKSPDGSANPGFVGTTTNHDLLLQAGTTAGGLNVMRFNTAGAERVRITDAGRVGIGTSSPGYALDVQIATSSANTGARIYNSTAGTGNSASLSFSVANAFSSTNQHAAIQAISEVSTNTLTSLAFLTSGGSNVGNATERARIDSSGNVGIGTTSPLTKLEVRSGVITAGSVDAPNGAEILRGYYGSSGALVVIGSEYSSGGTVIGYAVKPSTTTTDAFLSSASGALPRGAYTIAGNIHKWYIGGIQTVAENSSVTMSEAMRIDSSGRVGIGTTSPSTALQINATTPTIRLEENGGGSKRLEISIDSSGLARIDATQSSSQLLFGTVGTERARIDASGRLLVGTSSAFDATADAVIQAAATNGAFACLGNSDTSVITNENLGLLRFFSRGGSVWEEGARIEAEADLDHASGDKPTRLVFSTTADGASSPTERMRISQNGNAYIGTTADLVSDTNSLHVSGTRAIVGRATGGATNPVITSWNNATSGDNVFISFRTETADTERGTIDYNRAGGQVRYNVTSDRRLKSEIQPAASALDNLAAIQVRAYKWTETDYQINYGFVAQELNEVAPDAVKEGDYGEEITNVWAVDNSKLVPLLTKALQEAIARIETLEAKVAALESA
jgi:hypothetical protein